MFFSYLFFKCPWLKLILMSRWQVWRQHILPPSPDSVLSTLPELPHLILTTTLWGKLYTTIGRNQQIHHHSNQFQDAFLNDRWSFQKILWRQCGVHIPSLSRRGYEQHTKCHLVVMYRHPHLIAGEYHFFPSECVIFQNYVRSHTSILKCTFHVTDADTERGRN